MYKLIAIDLDGTLLDDRKDIPEGNINLMEELLDKGYELVIATGRRYFSAKEFVKDFDRDFLIIANNGNMVRHTDGDRLISADYVDSKYLEFILNLGKSLDIHPVIHINIWDDGTDLVGELDRYDERYNKYVYNEPSYRQLDSLLEEDLEILSIVYLGDYEVLSRFEREIRIKYPKGYRTYLMGNIHFAEALLEVVHPQGSKWDSILKYAETKGIKKEEIITIGDDTNDLEMIEGAGLGIAMKNGADIIVEKADLVTELDNNEAGLAHELRKVLGL